MCVFKERHFGALLDKQIADFLAEYTTMDDVNRAAMEVNISFSYLKNIRSRNHPLSEKSSKAIIRLMEIAVENCGNIADRARVDKTKMKKLLKK